MATEPSGSGLFNPGSFFFGGDTNVTYEELQRRRAIAAALAGRQRAFPKTLGEGLTYFGEQMGEALGDMRLRRMEEAQKAKEAGVAQGGPPASFTPPVGGSRSSAVDPDAVRNNVAATIVNTAPEVPQANPMSAGPQAPESPQASAPISPPLGGPQDDDDAWARRQTAIGGIESAGRRDPYRALGSITESGDRAYGKYQVMGSNIPRWTREALGQELTPQQFLANDKAQDAVFRHRFGKYVNDYGEEGAARAWYGGPRGMRNLNATDMHGRLTVGGYGRDYLNRLDGAGSGGGAPIRVASLDPASAISARAPAEAAGNPPIDTDIGAMPTMLAQAPGNLPMQLPRGEFPVQQRAPGLRPSQEPIPPATLQQMEDPGAEPARPPILGPSKAQQYWSRFMDNPNYSKALQAYATRQYQTEEKYRQEIEQRQANDFENQRTRWHARKTEYDKFKREEPDRIIAQLKSRADVERVQADLEKMYYERGIPREQAAEKARVDIDLARRNLEKPDTVGAAGTHFERPAGQLNAPFAVPAGLPPAKEEPLTETQSKAAQFVIRVMPDLQMLDNELRYGKILTSPAEAARASVPGIGNLTMSNEYRRAHNAVSNWAAGFITHVSGAAVSPSEAARNLPAFVPSAGDTDQDLIDKAQRRRSFTEALRRVSGREGLAAIEREVGALNDDYMFKKASEAAPVRVSTPADAQLLPPGQRIIRPDGSMGQVPKRKRQGEQ